MSDLPTLDAIERQMQLAAELGRRPWPLPDAPWSQAQTQRDVLLAHWPVPLAELARLLPPELAVDTFDGEAWLGVAAYRVSALRARGLPPLPGLSSFPQLETRTYVSLDGRPGIWLVSLEATKQLLVETAKRRYRLPAYRADIQMADDGAGVLFDAARDGRAFRARYAGEGEPAAARPGTLDHFVAERYAVYTADGGRLYRAELHHSPSSFQPARVRIEASTLLPLAVEGGPHSLFGALRDVLMWPLEEL